MGTRLVRVGFVLAAIIVAAGCSDDADRFVPPDAPGPFKAGTYSEIATTRAGSDMMVQVWYPVSSGTEEEFDYSGLGFTSGSAIPDAPAACAFPRPVVMFSHGNAGINWQTYTLAEHLARHGYVVAAPNHPENTVFQASTATEMWPWLYLHRPGDIVDAFDWLAARAGEADAPFGGCVVAQAGYAMVGHSFGGWTTFGVAGAPLDMVAVEETCVGDTGRGCQYVAEWRAAHPGQDTLDESDPRVWAAVPLAPAFHELYGSGMASIEVPTLVVGADSDTVTPWESAVAPAYAALQTVPRFLAGLENAGHYSFTDACDLLLAVGAESNGCEPGFRPVADVLETLRVAILAFLEWVRGEAAARDYLPPAVGISHWEGEE